MSCRWWAILLTIFGSLCAVAALGGIYGEFIAPMLKKRKEAVAAAERAAELAQAEAAKEAAKRAARTLFGANSPRESFEARP